MVLRFYFTFFSFFLAVTPAPVAAETEWIDQKEGSFVLQPGTPADGHHFNGLTVSPRIFAYYGSYVDPTTGIGWHRVHITNDENHGHHICSETMYSGPGVTLTVSYRIGLDPDDEGYDIQAMELSPEQWAKVEKYRIRAGYCPDPGPASKVWNAVEVVVDTLLYVWKDDDQSYHPKTSSGSASSGKVVDYVWASIPCRKGATTGHVQVEATSPISCDAAKQQIRDGAGRSCKSFFGAGEPNGEINFSVCGTAVVYD